MMTGEGKTLTATMPVYLNALEGKGVHVVTVNEYLSSRDEEEMGQLYKWLGLTVGLNLNSMSPDESVQLTTVMLLTQLTQNLALTICVTTWLFIRNKWFNVH